MVLYEAASTTLSYLRDGLIRPLFWNVTWMLNKLLGQFKPYVGIGQNFPLMRKYELPPWEPDCSMLMDWIPVVALVLCFLYSLALIIIVVEARRTPGPGHYPEDHSNDATTNDECAAEDSLHGKKKKKKKKRKKNLKKMEPYPRSFEDFWYRVGEDQWRCHVKFVVNGHEKVFYVYSDNVEEMRENIQNGLPDYAVNGLKML